MKNVRATPEQHQSNTNHKKKLGAKSAGEAVSMAPLSTGDALSALFQIPEPEKAIRDADAKSRKGRKSK